MAIVLLALVVVPLSASQNEDPGSGGPAWWLPTNPVTGHAMSEDWTSSFNAGITASDCAVNGLLSCGNYIYGDGAWFRSICQTEGVSAAVVAQRIRDAAAVADTYGSDGVVVHWNNAGGYSPGCIFSGMSKYDVPDY